MKKFLTTYDNPNEKEFNYPLINREYDGNIVDYIVNCCKSLEALSYIKFIGYTHITDESKIDTSEYISKKARGKLKNGDIKRFMHLEDSRYSELRLLFRLTCNGETADVTKKILIPMPDKNGYYLIKGTKYLLMYQVVDNSTYTTKKSLTLKSMMPVPVQMKIEKFSSVTNAEFYAPLYTIRLSKKDINILVFYLARFGFEKTLEFFSLTHIFKITEDCDVEDESVVYFNINNKLYLEVNRKFFEKYQYTRTMTIMLLSLFHKKITIDMIYDTEYWITFLGSIGTSNKNNQYEKGKSTLTYFDRMLDDTTKGILKLHPLHTRNIYTIMRWMIMHFDDLRKKDNLDLNNRRLRCNEYIAALLTTTLSERVNRILSMGSKATLDKVKDIFKFPGDILITQLHKSGLLNFRSPNCSQEQFGNLFNCGDISLSHNY